MTGNSAGATPAGADGRVPAVRLVGVRAHKDGKLVGQRLRELREHIPSTEARIVAIYRKTGAVKPEGETIIEDGDEVFFLAGRDYIRRVMTEMRKDESPMRRIVIIKSFMPNLLAKVCNDALLRAGMPSDGVTQSAQG